MTFASPQIPGAEKIVANPALSSPALLLVSLPDDLDGLNARVRKEFLALSEALQNISRQAREVANLSREATQLLGEGESHQSTDTLEQVLADADRLRNQDETSHSQIREILSLLQKCRFPLARLAQMRQSLPAFAILARIEAARLRNKTVDVTSLTVDIQTLAGELDQHVSSIAQEARRLAESMTGRVRQVDEMEKQERQQGIALIGRTRAVLEPLHARAQAAEANSHKIDQEYASIQRALDKIVMSLQTEDMARQRIEHVQEALRQISARIEAGEPVADYGGIVKLQRSQLLATRDLLSGSVASILASLRSLSPRVEELAAGTDALLGQTDEDRRSFALAAKEGLAAVSSVFEQYFASSHSIAGTVTALLPAVEGMTNRANQLKKIESTIRHVAVNATVKTSQLGAEGAAMCALASELQKLAAENEGYTREVIASLGAMDTALKDISANEITDDACAGTFAKIAQLTESAEGTRDSVSEKLSAVVAKAGALETQLGSASEQAEQAASVSEAFDALAERLDTALSQLGYEPGETLLPPGADKAADLNTLYSMRSERDVHEKCFGQGAPEEAPAEPASDAPPSDDDLGDGIELF